MIRITEHNILNLYNLISVRALMNQNDLIKAIQEINKIIDESTTKRNGQFITGTYSNNIENGEMIMDVEILCPVKQKIDLPNGYTFKSFFHLTNAVKLEYQGNPEDSRSAIQELMQYINENELTPITALYSITTYEPKSQDELNSYSMELYIGISKNIL